MQGGIWLSSGIVEIRVLGTMILSILLSSTLVWATPNSICANSKSQTARLPALEAFFKVSASFDAQRASQSDMDKVVNTMDLVLEETSTGKELLKCYRSKNSESDVQQALLFLEKRSHEELIADHNGLIAFMRTKNVSPEFVSQMEDKRAVGLYRVLPNQTYDGYLKTIKLDSTILQRSPLFFLLIYAHELQHGCRKIELSVSEFLAAFQDRKCIDETARSEFWARFWFRKDISESAKKICASADESHLDLAQNVMADEVRSFRSEVAVLNEIAQKDSSICKLRESETSGAGILRGDNFGDLAKNFEEDEKNGSLIENVVETYLPLKLIDPQEPKYFYEADSHGIPKQNSKGRKILNATFASKLK